MFLFLCVLLFINLFIWEGGSACLSSVIETDK